MSPAERPDGGAERPRDQGAPAADPPAPDGVEETDEADEADEIEVVEVGDGEPWADDGWVDDGWADEGWAEGAWAGAEGDEPSADERLQAGVEHLQRAANELIAASRALLDAAEELVQEPRALGGLLGLFGEVGDLAARFTRGSRPGPRPTDADHDGGDDDGEPPVQRIPVS